MKKYGMGAINNLLIEAYIKKGYKVIHIPDTKDDIFKWGVKNE